MKRMIIAAALLVTGLLTQTASAQGPGIGGTQVKQQVRIKQGVRNGELTRREAAHLQMQQAQIKHDKRVAKSDGVVTPRERAYIKAEQAHAAKNIYVQKHDCQGRR